MADSPETPSDHNSLPNLSQKNDVFISYSRQDIAFVEQLYAHFQQVSRDPWVDWDDIYKGEDWWKSIQKGIEEADSFVFVISPDSVASSVCRKEIDYAAQLNKRFLPLLWRQGYDRAQLHPAISQHNWIDICKNNDISGAFQELLKALDTDLAHVRAHTRLLVRSLEWLNKGKDSSYLLRGLDLEEAQHWLSQGLNKQPHPTDGQVAYINASLEARAAALKARQKAKWIVVLTTVLVNLAFVTGGLYGIYRSISHIAQQEVTLSMEETLEATLARIDGDKFAELTQVEVPPGQIEPIDNPLYQEHQKWLETVNWIAPKAYPATYIKGAKDNEMVAIGDVYRITNPEYDYPFKSVIPEDEVYPEMLEGFKQVTPILTPMENDYGSFVMIFGPIKNRAGQVVGALCLQYDSTYVTDIKDQIRRIMTIACTIALIWLVISSWLILQATRPPRELLAGGDGAASPPKDVALL